MKKLGVILLATVFIFGLATQAGAALREVNRNFFDNDEPFTFEDMTEVDGTKTELGDPIVAQIDAALTGQIITFGISPRSPETGFGYIQKGAEMPDFPGLHIVDRFIEKPPLEKAMELFEEDLADWASGISMFSARTIIEEEPFLPEFKATVWYLTPVITAGLALGG